MKVLVIAAHPDDEVYTIGGTIATLAGMGHNVYVVYMTYYGARLKGEQEKALELLGGNLGGVRDYGDTTICMERPSVVAANLSGFIEDRDYDIVFTHHVDDTHCDHSALGKATLVATRGFGGTVAMYQATPNTPIKPDWFVPISKNNIMKKMSAITAYSSEKRVFPHFRSHEGVGALDTLRGVQAGFEKAEAFEIVRKVGF